MTAQLVRRRHARSPGSFAHTLVSSGFRVCYKKKKGCNAGSRELRG